MLDYKDIITKRYVLHLPGAETGRTCHFRYAGPDISIGASWKVASLTSTVSSVSSSRSRP